MHYQRMDPQPHPEARLEFSPGLCMPSFITAGRWDIGPVWLDKHVFFHGFENVCAVPADMPCATPWRDRDGEWYWRRDLHS